MDATTTRDAQGKAPKPPEAEKWVDSFRRKRRVARPKVARHRVGPVVQKFRCVRFSSHVARISEAR